MQRVNKPENGRRQGQQGMIMIQPAAPERLAAEQEYEKAGNGMDQKVDGMVSGHLILMKKIVQGKGEIGQRPGRRALHDLRQFIPGDFIQANMRILHNLVGAVIHEGCFESVAIEAGRTYGQQQKNRQRRKNYFGKCFMAVHGCLSGMWSS